MVSMITVGVIRNGATYLSHHLRKNDYWAEGEKEVRGEWIGEGAKALGLVGAVTDPPFDALRQNRHPNTGEALTARDHANRVAFFDIQLSAPKDVSVLAMVGGDDRVRDAFIESVKTVLAEMERFSAVRERKRMRRTRGIVVVANIRNERTSSVALVGCETNVVTSPFTKSRARSDFPRANDRGRIRATQELLQNEPVASRRRIPQAPG